MRTNGKDADEMITMAQAAVYAGVPRRTVNEAAKRGHLKAKRVGYQWVTTRRDVDAWKQSPLKRASRTP